MGGGATAKDAEGALVVDEVDRGVGVGEHLRASPVHGRGGEELGLARVHVALAESELEELEGNVGLGDEEAARARAPKDVADRAIAARLRLGEAHTAA